MLHQLIYVSDIEEKYPYNIEKMVADARDFNQEHNITGALWFNGAYFIQMLEGNKPDLDQAYNDRILPAHSHRNVDLLYFEPAEHRNFTDWSMAYFGEKTHCAHVAELFGNGLDFKPHDIPALQLKNLLCYFEDERQQSARRAI